MLLEVVVDIMGISHKLSSHLICSIRFHKMTSCYVQMALGIEVGLQLCFVISAA